MLIPVCKQLIESQFKMQFVSNMLTDEVAAQAVIDYDAVTIILEALASEDYKLGLEASFNLVLLNDDKVKSLFLMQGGLHWLLIGL